MRRCMLVKKRKNIIGQRGKHQPVEHYWETMDMLTEKAVGFAVSKHLLGNGVERRVHEMFEVDYLNRPVGVPLVAKCSRYVEDDSDEFRFQESFVKTQSKAQRLAERFNRRLDQVGIDPNIPRITFLECSVYEYWAIVQSYGFIKRAFLAEPRLSEDYTFKKWNDNTGWVDGNCSNKTAQEELDHESEVAVLLQQEGLNSSLAGKCEENDQKNTGILGCPTHYQYQMEDEERSVPPEHNMVRANNISSEILDDDIPQAFSHFTYSDSGRKLMVVDIQGVLNHAKKQFELTDPCIHYRCQGKSKKVGYGRTDRGLPGMHDFFISHQCNPACKALGLLAQTKK